MRFFDRLNSWFMPKHLTSFRPYHPLFFKVGKYTVRTAETPDDLYWVLRLRYQVFYKKYFGRTLPLGLDITPYDHYADHILVCDEGGKIVGTYRVISNQYRFYSESEFEIGPFLYPETQRAHKLLDIGPPQGFVELSRACIDPKHRQGAVIACLWKGIHRYVKEVGGQHIFGCVSVHTKSAQEAAEILVYLKKSGHHRDDFSITPRPEYSLKGLKEALPAAVGAVTNLPPLFMAYLKMGAKVYGEPAYDPKFQCIDFFSILKMDELGESYQRKLGS